MRDRISTMLLWRQENRKNCETIAKTPTRYTLVKTLLTHQHFWFFFALTTWFTYRVLSTSFYANLIFTFGESTIRLFVFALLFLHEIKMRQDKKTIISILILALAFYVGTKTGFFYYIDVIVLLFSARKVSFKHIARITFAVTLSMLIFVILSSQFGLITDYLWEREKGIYSRHGLGFQYTTFATHYLLRVTLLYIYLKREKASFLVYIALFIFNFYLYQLTQSRTSFLLTSLAIIAAITLKYRNINYIFENFHIVGLQ